MEWRNQDKAMGSSAKRSLSNGEEEQKRKEDSTVIHEGTIFNPSPDPDGHQTRTRRDPDPPDPDQIRSQPEPVTRYRECQKNHAAHLGNHVLDGCGEFMPQGDDGTLESLNCAACGCHRNFHRIEASSASSAGGGGLIMAPTPTSNFRISFNARHQHTNILTPFPFRQAPAAVNHHRRFSDQAPSAMMNFGEGGDASSEDLNLFRSDGEGYGGSGSSRKRFRTKFTQEQKEKMMELAEKIGWRIQKQDESQVQQFCATTGVKRQVFKVWMHNNKQAMKRKQS